MTSKEKISKSLELIKRASYKDQRVNANEIYEAFREVELFEIAEDLTNLLNLVYDLREVLEDEE